MASPEQPTAAEELRRWLDDTVPPGVHATDDGGTVAPRTRRRMAVVAAAIGVPWVVVVAAMLSGRSLPTRHEEPSVGAASEAGLAAGFGSHDPTEPDRDGGGPTEPDRDRGGPTEPDRDGGGPREPDRDGGGPTAAGPLAVGLVRDAVTRVDDDATTAVDVAAAEEPRPVGDATWIVRVHAVVLHGDGRHWRSRSHQTWAVPIGRRDGTVVGLDRPWRISRGGPPTTRIRWRPADVADVDVRSALRRAGLRSSGDLVVERHPDLTAVLRVTSSTPAGRTRVWLRSTPSALVVLGSDDTVAARP